mmetsp:Transcript_109503/g.308943  ORF Transcript_109503/g.308943 Transcript_109503/m.308943 type:complete len:216 (-) Transcript_109503:426-1073(-)
MSPAAAHGSNASLASRPVSPAAAGAASSPMQAWTLRHLPSFCSRFCHGFAASAPSGPSMKQPKPAEPRAAPRAFSSKGLKKSPKRFWQGRAQQIRRIAAGGPRLAPPAWRPCMCGTRAPSQTARGSRGAARNPSSTVRATAPRPPLPDRARAHRSPCEAAPRGPPRRRSTIGGTCAASQTDRGSPGDPRTPFSTARATAPKPRPACRARARRGSA